jgi:Ca2+-binding RTX toxin-like protein
MPTFFVAAAAGVALVASLFSSATTPPTAAPAGPEPSTVWIEGRTLYFSAADRTVNDVSVEPAPNASGYVLIRDDAGTPIRAADPCVLLAANLVRCPWTSVDFMTTVLRGEDDQFSGGAGNDKVYAGPGDDRLKGGLGNDLLYGEAGDDLVSGGPGIDWGDGGADLDTCLAEGTTDCE